MKMHIMGGEVNFWRSFMEQLLESYHGKGDKSRVLKLISYGEGPIKKVLKKYEK